MTTSSSSDRVVEIGIAVDSTQAEAGLRKIGGAAQSAADTVKKAGAEAGAGVQQIGHGAEKASQNVDRATRSMIAAIERTTTALKTGGRASAEYYETLAKQRGISGDALKPYIDGLKKAEEAQKLAQQSMQGMGVSAAQTAAAMRNVPAQFTDIVVSLQGGQAPLTVLLQQGGQLKDMFGGVGNAARALGDYILGLVNPYTVAAVAIGGLAVAYEKGASEIRSFERALILSGNQAGVTSNQLMGIAAATDSVIGTQAKAAEVLTLMASSSAIGAENMQRFTVAAIAMEQAGGQAAEETVSAFIKLGQEPLKAALELNKAQGFLTAGAYEQIKALEDQGRTTDAARVAQEAYAKALEDRAPAMLQQLGTLQRGWLAVKNATKEAVDALLSVGRQTSPLDDAKEKLRNLQENQAGARSDNKAKYQPAIDAMNEQIALLKKAEAQQEQNARQKKEELRLVGELAEWDKKGAEFADKKAKRDKEMIAEAVKGRALVNAGLLTEEQLKTRLLAITEKYKETEKKGPKQKQGDEFAADRANAKAWAQEFEQLSKAAGKAEADMLGLTKVQAKLLEFLKSPEYANGSEEMRQIALQAAYAGIAFEQEEAAMQAAADAQKALTKEHEKYIQELSKGAAQAQDRLEKLAMENEAAGIAAAANITLAEAIEQVAIARLQELQAVEMSFGNEDAVQAIQAEIDARKQLQKEIAKKDARKDEDDAAKDAKKEAEKAVKEWEKASEKINDTITDALMRGFESGKGFAESLRDTVVNMFKTMVLRPVVSAIVSPISSGIQSMIGGAIGGGGVGGSMLGSAASIASSSALFGGTSLSALGSAFGEGFMATLGGSSISGGTAAGLLAGGAAPGTGIAGTLGAAAPYALAAGAVLAALGAFRTTKTVGGGLQGTLGEGDITGYDLRRKSGYLFGGPDYSIRDTGVSAQSKALQDAYLVMRSASVGMADALGLGSDAIKSFTTTIGTDLIHPDTGGMGLKFDGLNEQQINEKITKALEDADDRIAAELLGVKTVTVNSITKMVTEAVGPLDEWGQSIGTVTREVTESFESTAVTARKDLLPWMQRIVDTMGPSAEALKKLYTYSDELLVAAGTSRDELVKIYTEGFMSGDVSGAGQKVADTLVASIEQTMIGGAAGQIFDIANRGIITPILDAMLNGQTLSQALADGAIDATITKIKEKATALAEIMNDPRIKELMTGLKTSLGGALGGGSAAMNYTPQYQPPAQSSAQADAAKEAEKAAEEARKKWQDITDALKSDQENLLIEKLKAQGRESEALALEFEIATRGMDEYQIGLARQNQETRTQIDLLNKTNAQRDEYASLEVELLRVQGRESDALAAQRRLDVRGMTDTEIELYDLNAARRAEIDSITKNKEAIENLWQTADSVAEKYLSGGALKSFRFESLARQINEAVPVGVTGEILAGLGVSDIQEAVRQFVMSDAAPDAKAQILSLGAALIGLGDAARSEAEGLRERIFAATDTGDEAMARQRAALQNDENRALFDLAIAAEKAAAAASERVGLTAELNGMLGITADLRQKELAALDKSNRALKERVYALSDARAATDAAYAGLERAINAKKATAETQKQAASDLLNEVKSVFDLLSSSVRDLYSDVDQTRAMQSAQGMAFIDSALASARSTGVLPDTKELQDAISAVRRGFDGRDATDRDAAFEKLVAAGKLGELEKISGTQLTTAERQLKAAEDSVEQYDEMLRQYKTQIDVMRGIDVSIKSVDGATSALKDAITAEQTAQALALTELQKISAGVGGIAVAVGDAVSKAVGSIVAMRSSASVAIGDAVSATRSAPTAGGGVRFDAGLQKAAQELYVAQGAGAVIDAIKSSGYTMQEAGTILGIDPSIIESEAAKLGIPKFAVGTNYVPHDTLAIVHKGEAIIPRPYNPAAGGGMSMDAVLLELRDLRELTANMLHQQRRTADAVNGFGEQPMEFETI